jgi:hypothetical protein
MTHGRGFSRGCYKTRAELEAFVRDNMNFMTRVELAKSVDLSVVSLYRLLKKMKVPPPAPTITGGFEFWWKEHGEAAMKSAETVEEVAKQAWDYAVLC